MQVQAMTTRGAAGSTGQWCESDGRHGRQVTAGAEYWQKRVQRRHLGPRSCLDLKTGLATLPAPS